MDPELEDTPISLENLAMQGIAPYADNRPTRLGPPHDVVPGQRPRRHNRPDSIHAVLYPYRKKPFPGTNSVPWIFAAKTTASGLIALLVAFTFNLDQLYWAMLTVFMSRSRCRAGRSWRRAYIASSGL